MGMEVYKYGNDSDVEVKWVLQHLRSTNVSQHNCGKHVVGGVTPQEIQTHASHRGDIMKLVLLEKLQ
jgi:hypothetical protein